VRADAAYILSRLRGLAIDAVGALAAAASDADANVRIAALGALEAMGGDASEAMGTVAAALKDPNASVRLAAARTLGAMQEPPPSPEQQMQAISIAGTLALGAPMEGGPEGGAAPGVSDEQQRQQELGAAIQQFWDFGKAGV